MITTKKRLKCALVITHLILCSFLHGQNPILKNLGVSDPHIRVFNDTVYLYAGHDTSPNDKTWVMKDWRVFSTIDLVNWSLRNTISPKENYMDDDSSDCWASDAISRNGMYYFYFSDGKRGIGVMNSNSAVGPFKDALGKPLVAPMHDPTILIDDDSQKTPYLIYGDKAGGGFHITKLNNDMISVSETPKPIQVFGSEWENAPHWMDKNYLFKHKDTYYLSWGRDYAISKNIYGPYQSVGAVGTGYNLNELAHGSFFHWKGQFYHIWCYYIKPGYKYRESIITYCHIDDEGKIVTDTNFLDQHFDNGLGQYNASWDRLEAEWFYEISGNILKTGNTKKGFVLSNIKNGDWLKFSNVSFDKVYNKVVANLAFKGKSGELEVRIGHSAGKRIGLIKLSEIKELDFMNAIGKLETKPSGKQDIYIVFKASKDSTLKIDWIKFEEI